MNNNVDYSKVSSEFYYFDGVEFQRCMTINSSKGIPIDKEVEDYLQYIGRDTIETLLTFSKIEKRCLYKLENVNSYLNILTPKGWELVTTDTMNIRAKELDTKSTVIITISNPLPVDITDTTNLPILNIPALEVKGIPNPIVRPVPKVLAKATITFNNLSIVNTNTTTELIITKSVPMDVAITDKLLLNKINTDLTTKGVVEITLN